MKFFFMLTFLLVGTLVYANSKDLGVIGSVYPIAEVDIQKFIENRAAAFDYKKFFEANRERIFKEATTAKLVLPVALKDETRKIAKEHVLELEIYTVNASGRKQIIYPAGFKYNPLDYIKIPEKYVVINAVRPQEMEWLKRQALGLYVLIVSEGDLIKLSNELERPAYMLTEAVKDALYVRYTPSVIYQEGNRLRIDEYRLEP